MSERWGISKNGTRRMQPELVRRLWGGGYQGWDRFDWRRKIKKSDHRDEKLSRQVERLKVFTREPQNKGTTKEI